MQPKITVFESDSASLWFYPESGIIHHQFLKPLTGDMFQKVLLAGLQLMNEHHARKWLSDDRGNSALSADDSAWSQEFWLPCAVKAGWKYWAMIPPEKMRGQLNTRRLTSYVGEECHVTIKVFADPEAAFQWLVEQKSVGHSS